MTRLPACAGSAFIAVCLLIGGLSGCGPAEERYLEREHLFTMNIGKMEDQVDLLQLEGTAFDQKIRLYMKDGLYYLSNGASAKIMHFSSYGDLLSLYYNPAFTPQPFLVTTNAGDGKVSNRRGFPFPFRKLGEFAVDSDKTLLVEDVVVPERAEFDEESGVVFDRVVLRIDGEGKLVDYLGQEGIGGTPFPFIETVQVSGPDDIVVISRNIESWIVFWFNIEGRLRYRIEIPIAGLPAAEEGLVSLLETVQADPDMHRIYLKINYYRLDGRAGSDDLDFYKSSIYWYDVETERYTGWADVPENIIKRQGNGLFDTTEFKTQYELIGVASGGYLFLLSPATEERYNLLIQSMSGLVVAKVQIEIVDSDVIYRDLYVTPNGILSGFLGGSERGDLYVWRTDRMLREGAENGR